MAKRIKLNPDVSNEDPEEQSNTIHINSLPNEILIKVFRNLGLYDQNSASLVCKRWLDIAATQNIMMKFPFVLKYYLKSSESPMSVLLKSQRKFPFIWVEGKFGSHFYSRNFLQLMDTIGQNVLCLYFDKVPHEILINTLHKCPNLETLMIKHDSAVIRSPQEMKVACKSLKRIIIKEDVDLIERNIKKFETYVKEFKNHVESFIIQNIRFNCEYLEGMESERFYSELENFKVDKDLLKYVEKLENAEVFFEAHNLDLMKCEPLHFKHITYLKLFQFELLNLGYYTNLKILHYYPYCCSENHKIQVLPTLESFSIILTHFCSQCFTAKLESFPNLKVLAIKSTISVTDEFFQLLSNKVSYVQKLILEMNLSDTKYENPLFDGFENLKELQLLFNFGGCSVANFPQLTNLPKLETFHIKITEKNCDETWILGSIFQQLSEKMANLTHLTIAIDFLEISEMKSILQKFPKLTTFRLKINQMYLDDAHMENYTETIIESKRQFISLEFHAEKCISSFSNVTKNQARANWVKRLFVAIDSLQKVKFVYNGVVEFTPNETQFYNKGTLDENDFDPFYFEKRGPIPIYFDL